MNTNEPAIRKIKKILSDSGKTIPTRDQSKTIAPCWVDFFLGNRVRCGMVCRLTLSGKRLRIRVRDVTDNAIHYIRPDDLYDGVAVNILEALN